MANPVINDFQTAAAFWLLNNNDNKRIQEQLSKELTNQPGMPMVVRDKLKRMTDYMFFPHKHNATHILMQTAYRKIKPNADKEELESAMLLGVCFQMVSSTLLMIDDYADQSDFRNGQQSWHTLPENQDDPAVIVDFLLLEKSIMRLVQKFFGQMGKQYDQIVELLNLNCWKIHQGNVMDCVIKVDGLDKFTWEDWKFGAECKLAYWILYLPISLALTLDGYLINEHVHLFEKIENVSKELGQYFQRKDDYLDCFAKETFDSMYMDVKEGKGTWLTLMTRDRCIEENRPDQWQLLKENYGKGEDDNCVEKCINVFTEMNLHKIYENCNNEQYGNIKEQVGRDFEGNRALADALLTIWELASHYPF